MVYSQPGRSDMPIGGCLHIPDTRNATDLAHRVRWDLKASLAPKVPRALPGRSDLRDRSVLPGPLGPPGTSFVALGDGLDIDDHRCDLW